LGDLPGVHDASIDHTRARFSIDTGELNRILEYLTDFEVRTLTSSPPTLEELFMRHYGEDVAARDADADGVAAR
jgi:ABC-2 type transport system ATP-binding protein